MAMAVESMASTSPLSLSAGRSHVYLCLSKQHRVSRSVRATWFLSTLLQELPQELFVKEEEDECCGGLSADFGVLSMSAPPTITPHTQFFFLCQQYSLVFLVDLSENMRSVSNHTHLVKVDSALSALYTTLTLLTRPLHAPQSSVIMEPELCVTILAYCGSSAQKAIHVLLQGVYIKAENCPEVIAKVKAGVTLLEISLSTECDASPPGVRDTKPSLSGTQSTFGDAGLETMLKAGSLAIQLLPRCALKGLVLFTDGVSGFSSPLSMHNVINNMRGANVSCWVVHVGGGPHPMDALGHVPDTETLQFMTKACNGCLIDTNKIQKVKIEDHSPNEMQRAILFWTFQQGALAERVRGVACEGCDGWEDPFTPIIDRVFNRSTISAPLLCLVGCKIREGFFFKQVTVRESWLEVCLSYPWQPSVTIFYTITAPWPVSEECVTLQVTVSYEGPYSFVHDINCELNSLITVSYRQAAIRKFKQALKRFLSSDALLAHFLLFPTTPTHHILPQSVANGMPLFYFPPNQDKPAPSVSLDSSSGKGFSPLVNFWRPMCTIDTSQWFRWFHSDKVVLVLRQDSLLPAHLLSPAPSGRYATIQCRLSASFLYNFLKEWSSLALLENHSYIRFLPSSESPRFFCVVRVAQVLPCVVLHVGHIQGTPHDLQSHTVASLVMALRELTFTPSERPIGALSRKRPSLAFKAKASVTLLDKQMQRVMIRYEGGVVSSSGTSLVSLAHVEERSVQMDYLTCVRWMYTAPHTTPTLLSALLRRRLREGFLLSSSKNGIVTLIAQLKVKQPMSNREQALLLQYVIFPFSEHPTSELWVEPQYGRVCATPPGLAYLSEATHADIALKIHNIDQQLLTSVSTFLYLQYRCQPGIPLTLSHGSCDPVCKSCDLVSCQLDVYPGSLFESSRAIVLTLAAFSEDSEQQFVDLDRCSQSNTKFWTNLSVCLASLAPTQIPALTNTHTLLTRITASQQFASMKFRLSASNATEWKYFVLSHEESVCQLYLPDTLYSTGEGVFVLPIVIMDCSLANLIDPDPLSKEVPSKPPDLLLDWPLTGQRLTPPDIKEGLNNLLFSLSNAHLSSYLDVVHTSLRAGQDISPRDFDAALNVCSRAAVSVDLTPLLAAFCPHSAICDGGPPPLDTPTLAGLLESVVSRQSWRCAVRVVESENDEVFYQHWGEDTRAAICKSLADSQFMDVPNCLGYYHWRERLPEEGGAQQTEAPPTVLSPVSEILAAAKPVEESGPTPVNEPLPPSSDNLSVCSSLEEMDIDPLFSSSEDSDDETTPPTNHVHTPLFLNIKFFVTNKTTKKKIKLSPDFRVRSRDQRGGPNYIKDAAPLCMKFLQSKLGRRDGAYFVSMEMEFLSFTPPTHQSKRSEVTEDEESEGPPLVSHTTLSTLPPQYQPIANALQQKLDWLVADELVSIARKATPISQSLLQAVVAHTQRTHQSDICFSRRVPLHFVFGSNHSFPHFLEELEAIQVPNYSINKIQDYYYFSPKAPSPCHAHYRPPLSLIDEDEIRSKTPPPFSVLPKSKNHRRSLSSGYPRDHAPRAPPLSTQPSSVGVSVEGSRESLVESVSGYDASESCSVSSVSLEVGDASTQSTDLWIILRPLPELVEVCLQVRSSYPKVDFGELNELCENLEAGISRVCHRTNQWFLLKELWVTRECSPYLLSESASEAWVDEVVSKQKPVASKESREVFRGQEFMCDLKWKRHITPHWRLKDKAAQTALKITRTALNLFSVANRLDVYVLRDINSSGVESFFYLKIDESLCRVEESELDESITTGEEGPRPDTRATVEGTETLSTVSAHPSVCEVAPDAATDRKPPSPHFFSGKPQESLVLQLYGITPPSHVLTEKVNRQVQFKLDDAVLEAMCSLYARNQRLRLFPADVQFLQPTISEPTHILCVAVPRWVASVEALVFYFLQHFSSLTLRPEYTSSDHRDHFQVPLELQNAYLAETCDSSHAIHQDHLFLYIRPHHKGRGMAVISVSLVSPEGRVITPIPGIVHLSSKSLDLKDLQVEDLNCTITDIESKVKGQYSLRLHVWEKGNIGLTEFKEKVSTCFKHSLIDYVLELHLLQLPVATPLRDVRNSSPFVLLDYHDRRDSLNDELETVVEEGTVFSPSPSRKVSRDSHKADPRRGSNDSRRGSSDTKQVSRFPAVSSRRSSEDAPSRKTSTSSDAVKLEPTLQEVESISSPTDVPKRSRAFTEHIIHNIQEAMEGSDGKDEEKKERVRLEAHLGNKGALNTEYETIIPQHLAVAARLKALSVRQHSYPLLGSYSSKVFLTQAAMTLQELSPDLTINVFASNPDGQLLHFDPPKEWTKIEKHIDSKLRDLRYILIGRNQSQFKECLFPDSRSSQPWLDKSTQLSLQLFQPLDCLKTHSSFQVPLQHMPIAAEAFVPRQKLVLATLTSERVELWLYNFSEVYSKRVSDQLSKVHEWQSSRAGLAHHLLAQKLGLFQHTQAEDIQHYTKLAVKRSPTLKELKQLVRNNKPIISEAPPPRSRLQRPVVLSASPLLDHSYQNSSPEAQPSQTEDPVYNHGYQLTTHLTLQRKDLEREELLFKVFQSWQSRSQAPVNTLSISALKRMSRLLHFCCSPILPTSCSRDAEFVELIKDSVLSQYIAYLQRLGFQPIAERRSTPTSKQRPPPANTPTQSKLYKCLQRWWAGGIILAELHFHGSDFLVKLYGVEASRLLNQSPLTPESQSQFSLECARYKDFIHVHSFMLDFHLRLLLTYCDSSPPENFDLRQYINLCQNRPHPYFARNLLQRGMLDVATPTVSPKVLYQYLVVHCAMFGGRTLELRVGGEGSQDDVGLLIELSRKALGPVTSPQLSKLLEYCQGQYDIRVVVVLRLPRDSHPVLGLDYYLLLVHRDDSHPHLISHSPQLLPTSHPLPSGDSEDVDVSELSVRVQEHRRKMGILSTPPLTSTLVLDAERIQEHMVGVKGHLEDACQNALRHMRRDVLWKRMVYGQVVQEGGRPVLSFMEGLDCSEFRELLRLVTLVPLETLDQRLAPLRKQSRKWFKRLMLPLQVRFSENIRLYSTPDETYYAAAIVNPDWQDMCLLIQVDKETKVIASMYRHQKEGGVPSKERLLTANVEAERTHIEIVVNFMCSFLWASILDTSPPQPQLNLL